MIPFFKVFALMTRVFTRPLLMYIKHYHKTNKDLSSSIMARPFITLGNWQYHISIAINQRLLKVETDSDMFVKPLNTEIALEQGMELFYEIAVYSLVLIICIYEIRKYSIEGTESAIKSKTHIHRIETKLDQCLSKQNIQQQQLDELRYKIEEANKTITLRTLLSTRFTYNSLTSSNTSVN